jgi:citrate lyase beta subunit
MTAIDSFDIESRIASARSLLFVPGDRPDRIGKALGSGADGVIVDLEDAVRPENRAYARNILRHITDLASITAQPLLLVRVNAFGSDDFVEDVEVAIEVGAVGIVLPKFVSGQLANDMDETLSVLELDLGRSARLPVIGLVESAVGVLALFKSVALPTRVIRLAFGGADFHSDLGITHQVAGVQSDFAMAALVLASTAANLAPPLDSPHFGLDDDEGLALATRHARDIGFAGKLCIHPKQLRAIHVGFTVSDSEYAWAQWVLAQWNDPSSHGAGAIRVGDELIDEAMVRRARRILGMNKA